MVTFLYILFFIEILDRIRQNEHTGCSIPSPSLRWRTDYRVQSEKDLCNARRSGQNNTLNWCGGENRIGETSGT